MTAAPVPPASAPAGGDAPAGALAAEQLAPLMWDAYRDGWAVAWTEVGQGERDGMTAAARVAIGRLAPQWAALAAERDRLAGELLQAAESNASLRAQLGDLRTSLDYCAGQWESNAMPRTFPVRQPWQRAIYADCARDLRAALKVNAPDAPDVRAENARLGAELAQARQAHDTWAAQYIEERDGLHADRKRLTTALADTTDERDDARAQLAALREVHSHPLVAHAIATARAEDAAMEARDG